MVNLSHIIMYGHFENSPLQERGFNYGRRCRMEESSLSLLGFVFYKFIFSMLFLIVYIIKSISLFAIAKKRGVKSYWLSAFPILQGFVLGRICDDINKCNNKKTFIGISVFVLSFINAICFIGVASLLFTVLFIDLFYFLTVTIRILNLIILFIIYKDYYPKYWILFGVLSAFLWLEFIFLFCLINKEPYKI